MKKALALQSYHKRAERVSQTAQQGLENKFKWFACVWHLHDAEECPDTTMQCREVSALMSASMQL